ncbi:MAG: RluA family pseudouridine synthase [Bacteroidales bacterium]|nr:RluA family pseudouridine synthase [Bacteroidales bacterium]
MLFNNPYLYHPHPSLKVAADDICLYISQRPDWDKEFSKGKMLGVLLCRDASGRELILRAFSGIVNINDDSHYFVPPVYDLNNPDDFYLQEDEEISHINRQLANETLSSPEATQLKERRKKLSQDLQLKIFSHFNFLSPTGEYKNIVQIFGDAKRGLPPGGSGECAAPRLLNYANEHRLTPVALAEFWYGASPKNILRIHGQFYPSCIEKCSPILAYLIGQDRQGKEDTPPSVGTAKVLYEDENLMAVRKPAGLLSTPAKDTGLPNVETWLHQQYPDIKGPILAHRLDQATSGILLAAKNAKTHKLLQQGFENRTIHKCYVAWLDGIVKSDCGMISLPLCTNPDDRPRQVVDWQFGKPAQTRYRVIRREKGRTLIEFFPLTGRTHQLRLHAASPYGLDCPIVGDRLYNEHPDTSERLLLHATEIRLELGERIPLVFNDPSGFE